MDDSNAPRDLVTAPPVDELLARVEEFLRTEVYPSQVDSKIRFRVLVAASLLRVVGRELAELPEWVADEDGFRVPGRLIEHSGSLKALADGLRHGRYSIVDPVIYRLVREHVEGKLAIDAPDLVETDAHRA